MQVNGKLIKGGLMNNGGGRVGAVLAWFTSLLDGAQLWILGWGESGARDMV